MDQGQCSLVGWGWGGRSSRNHSSKHSRSRAALPGVPWPAEPLEGQSAECHTELPGTRSWTDPARVSMADGQAQLAGSVQQLWPGGHGAE